MPPAQDNARFIFIVLLVLWLNAGSDNGSGLLSGPALIAGRLQRQRAAYYTMSTSRWGDFAPSTRSAGAPQPDETAPEPGRYLNLTGFREEDGLAWDDLEVFRQRCLEWSRRAYPSIEGPSLWDRDDVLLPTWQNATGTVHGPWVRQPCSVSRQATSYNNTVLTGAVGSWTSMGGSEEEGAPVYMGGYGNRLADVNSTGNGSTVSEAALDTTPYDIKRIVEWGRNLTGQTGRMLVRITDHEDQEDERQLGPVESLRRLGPSAGSLARPVTASVSIEDVDGTGSTYDMRLHGVHWPRKGAMMLTTTSEKFSGIFGLPHLTPGEDFFRSSQQLLNHTLDKALREREQVHVFSAADPSFASPLWTSSVDSAPEGQYPAPHCEYIMYMQLHPVDMSGLLGRQSLKREAGSVDAAAVAEANEMNDLVAEAMRRIEDELRFPSGAPIPGGRVPDLQMSAVLYSPDCAYFVETKGPPDYAPAEGQHLRGLKSEMFVWQARLWMLAYAAILGVQVKLLLKQVRLTYTPSTLGRASFYTIAIMLVADGIVFSAAAAWTLTAAASFLPSLAVTFGGFLLLTIGGSFLSEIYAAQEPERRRRLRQQRQERLQRQQEMTAASGSGGGGGANANATANTTTTNTTAAEDMPFIIPSDQDIDAEIAELTAAATPLPGLPLPATAGGGTAAAGSGDDASSTPFSSVAGRLMLLGVCILFMSLAASTWWAAVRSAYANIVAALYLSLWVPQIVRNVERNSRRAFSWTFMIGQSVLRLVPVAYFWVCADNVLFARTDRTAFAALAAWVWVQLWVLAFQDVLGPRFGVPRGWAPEAWEYHPVLHEDNVEAGGLPIGLVSTADDDERAYYENDDGDAGEHGGHGGHGAENTAPKRRLSSSGLTVPSGVGRDGASAITNIWTMDCSICCETLDVPVVRAGVDDPTNGGVAGVLARRQYMVTPCRHIFHTACLEGWLRFRLQCPICREELPPL